MIVRRMLLSDLALQEKCLLVYCAVAWRKPVLMRMCASQKVDFSAGVVDNNLAE